MDGNRGANRRASRAGRGFRSRDRDALQILLDAYHQAWPKRVWQYAVRLDELLQVGLTEADLRRLVDQQLVEYRVEITKPRSKRRHFETWDNLSIPEGSCFVLTEPGAAAAAALMPGGKQADSTPDACESGRPTSRAHPRWDGRRLWWETEIIKEFRRIAPDQGSVLEQFQRQGWKKRLDISQTPAGERGGPLAQWIRDTVRNLNRGLKRIKFHADGSKHGMVWEYVG
jgi:hypothetical protein